jgi:hypothetical protein
MTCVCEPCLLAALTRTIRRYARTVPGTLPPTPGQQAYREGQDTVAPWPWRGEHANSASASPGRRLIIEGDGGLVSGSGAGQGGLASGRGSTDGTSVSLRAQYAAGEGGAAVACGANGACGVLLARARREPNVAMP